MNGECGDGTENIAIRMWNCVSESTRWGGAVITGRSVRHGVKTEQLSGKGNLTYGLHHGSHSESTVMLWR